jgi:hypothetical protein
MPSRKGEGLVGVAVDMVVAGNAALAGTVFLGGVVMDAVDSLAPDSSSCQ